MFGDFRRDRREVTFVGHERLDARSVVRSAVIDELGERKEIVPVVLVVIDVDPEVLFECLVDAFGLTVGLRMVSGGVVHADLEKVAKRAEKERNELGASVGADVGRSTMFGKDMNKEESCELFGGEFPTARDEDTLL